jgi:hypothetical protein
MLALELVGQELSLDGLQGAAAERMIILGPEGLTFPQVLILEFNM